MLALKDTRNHFRLKCGCFGILPVPVGIEFQVRNPAILEGTMPEKDVKERAEKDLRQGKSASTAAGEFVREEIEHVREGKHGARSPQQAIAIGLSKARRAGIPLKPPARGKTNDETRERAERDYEAGRSEPKSGEEGSTARGRSRLKAMQREPKSTASRAALSEHAKSAARKRRARA